MVLSVLPTDSECLGSSRNLVDGLVMVNLTGEQVDIFSIVIYAFTNYLDS